ncbi:MAG: glycoside hydrolase family 99-like domain-containing protein [Treponematales bacterium]
MSMREITTDTRTVALLLAKAAELPPRARHRIVAVFLPQFHPFKENDEWWGKGFTEWTNVAKARPRFKGHYQPHIPADLGFYDLRLPETRIEQARLAREHGIDAFCYYHYWFNGKPLMERPLEDLLKSGEPDFPFMFCWANENWTRAWDGGDKHILIEQHYSEADDRAHIRYLLPFFQDPRYLRIDNKPVFCVYRSTKLPDINNTIRIWREEAGRRGVELYICRMESFREEGEQYLTSEMDAAIEFSPHLSVEYSKRIKCRKHVVKRAVNKMCRLLHVKEPFLFPAVEYKDYLAFQKQRTFPKYTYYPSVTPRWDNSPRREKGRFAFWEGTTPELFGQWLRNVMEKFQPYSREENLIFINAWNEWGEGNHLEPDLKFGRAYLEEVRKTVLGCSR